MAIKTQSGTVKSVAASATSFQLELEWDNPSPPPLKLSETWTVAAGPMRDLAAALKVGEAATVEYDDAAPVPATGVKKP